MRGVEFTFSRLPAAWALVAGVAILAGAAVTRAHAQTPAGADESAFAVPRVAPHGSAGVALPQPLAPSEALRLRRIFALQAANRLAEATQQAAALDTSTPLGNAMLGTVLADRYLGPHMRADASALRAWLQSWPTLPDAPAVHGLLKIRLPKHETAPEAPILASLSATDGAGDTVIPVPEETESGGPRPTRNHALDHAVSEAARNGAAAVNRVLARTPGLNPAYAALLRGEAARTLFAANQDQDAYDLAHPAALSGEAALPGHIAGLAAWRLQRPDLAQPLFEAAWHAPITSSTLRAAAAFWAARAHLANHDPAGWYAWLDRAGDEPQTFYGILARRMLGLAPGRPTNQREVLGEADVTAVAATDAGMRAFALLQIGQPKRADAELRLLWPQAQSQPPLARAIMLVAERAGLVDLAAQLADLVQSADGLPRDLTRFPIPRLRPRGGFAADPALIYGIARTESNFNNRSVSAAGARGLMQIMPATARFIGESNRVTLHDPAVNLDLGQRYLAYLASTDAVNGDLLRLLASYNSGPTGFSRWAAGQLDRGDPLLFIESIPGNETRAFVPRVLAYTWIYAARLRLPTPSLDELAAGLWPRYRVPESAVATLN